MSDLLQIGFAKYGDNTGSTFFCTFKINIDFFLYKF